MYTRNNLRRKLAKTQRNLPTTTNKKERAHLIRKAEKYSRLLANMNRVPASASTPANQENSSIDEAVASYYTDTLLTTPELTTTRHKPFEDIFGTPYAEGYSIIKTVGDGDCLIHAILTSISPTYQQIPFNDRSEVGGSIRRLTIAPKITDPEDQEFFQGHEYLEDQHLLTLGNLLNYNFIVFQEVPARHRRPNLPPNAKNNINYLDIIPNKPWILLHNKLGQQQGADHYSAVKDPQDRLIIPSYEEGLATAKQLSGQIDTTPICDYKIGDLVTYKDAQYIIEERIFDESDPPRCTSVKLKNLDTNKLTGPIPVRDLSKLSGGAAKKIGRAKRHQTRRRNKKKHV